MAIFKSSTKPGELEAKRLAEQAMKSTMPKGAKPGIPSGTGGNVKHTKHHQSQ